MNLTITTDLAETRTFLVQVTGELTNRRGLNAALGATLAAELQDHFRARNAEPNKMGAPKTNFWDQVAEATALTDITEDGATVSVAEARYRIQLYGGTITPTGGRKFLTIPLIKEARGLRVSAYEQLTGKKLFRLPGTRVLVERSGSGDRSLVAGAKVGIRGKGGVYREVGIRGRSQIRAVYALKASVTILPDPRALPPAESLVTALLAEGDAWLTRTLNRGGKPA